MSDTSPVSNPASPPGSPTLLGDKQDNSKDGSDCGTKFELFCARTLDLSRQIVDTDDLRAVVHGWDNDKCYDQICTLLRAYYKYHETVRDLTEEARKEGRAEQSEKIETLTVQLTAAQNASSPTDTKKIEALEQDLQSSNDSCKTHANKNTTLEAELTAEKAKVTAARNASSPTDTKKIEALEQDLQSLNDSCKTHANKNTTLEAELTAEKAKVTAARNASSPTDTKKIEALEQDLQSLNDSCKTHANKNTTLEAELTAEKAKVTAAQNASSPTDTKKIEALEQDLQSLNDSCKTHANKNTTLEAELTAEKAKVTAARNASSPTDTKKIEALEQDLQSLNDSCKTHANKNTTLEAELTAEKAKVTAARNASSPTDTKKIEALEQDLQSLNDSCKTHANKNTTLEAELTAEKAKVTAARNASSPTDTKKIEALEQDLQSLNDSCKTHANKNTTLEAELTAEKAKVTAAQNASSPTDTKKIEALEKDLHLARSGDLGGNSRHSPDGKLFEEKIFEVLEEIEPTGTVESYKQKAGDTLLADTVVEAKSANQQQRESSYKGDQSSGLPKTARDMIATGRKLGVFVVQHRSIVYLSEKYTNMEVVKVKGMPILLVPNIRHEAVLKDTMAQALRVVRKAATQLTLDRDYFKSQIKTTIESVKAAFSNAEACSHSILCGFRHHEKLLCMGKFTEPTLQFSRQTYGPKIDALFAAVDEVKKEWVVIQQANKRLGGTAAASASTDMIDLTDNLEAPPAKKHKGSSDGLE